MHSFGFSLIWFRLPEYFISGCLKGFLYHFIKSLYPLTYFRQPEID
ncbi:MAG: hypothetical protein IJV35_02245 [Neisseriaceae bacterium]|nr:hypothetical protein [Neisseriaceae bacterium]